MKKQEPQKDIEIIALDDYTPSYEGYSDIVRFGNRYFRTRDAEGYSSKLEEIDKKEYMRLQNYRSNDKTTG